MSLMGKVSHYKDLIDVIQKLGNKLENFGTPLTKILIT